MIGILLIVLSCLVAIPVVILFAQVTLALFASKTSVGGTFDQSIKVAVLIPAHNEESVIRETIESIKSQLKNDDQIYFTPTK